MKITAIAAGDTDAYYLLGFFSEAITSKVCFKFEISPCS